MASLLDERPKARGPILFGNALVRAQESDRKAREDERDARLAEDREKRMSEAQRVAQSQRDRALQLQEQALRLNQIAMSTKLAETKAELDAKEVAQQTKKSAMEQYGKAAIALGKLNPKEEDYDVKVSEIQAAHPDAFTFDSKIAESLNNIIASKTKARDLFIASTEKVAADQRAKADVAEKMEQAKKMGLSPTQATVDGFVFKPLDVPKTYESFEQAQADNPKAQIQGNFSNGKFVVEKVGTKTGEEATGSSLLPTGPSATVKPQQDQMDAERRAAIRQTLGIK